MSARALAQLGILGLLGLILSWHLLLEPPLRVPSWFAAALHASPLIPALWLLMRRSTRAPFFGALAALILFCHGVTEAWSAPATRALASAEIALSLMIIGGASWDGLKARFGKRRGV